jgi:hypothetical protein
MQVEKVAGILSPESEGEKGLSVSFLLRVAGYRYALVAGMLSPESKGETGFGAALLL